MARYPYHAEHRRPGGAEPPRPAESPRVADSRRAAESRGAAALPGAAVAAGASAARAAIYMARHGQTAYNRERRFQGQLPIPLDAEGRAQSRALAEAAAAHKFVGLWCSPLLRARQTAEIVAARIRLEPREDARLMETDAGAWTDRSFADVQAEDPADFARFAALDPTFAFPDGESFTEQAVRVRAALEDVRGGQTPALVVCHGVVIRLALARYLPDGAPPPRVPNATLIALSARPQQGAQPGERAGMP
jgi:broad specificity phosphatase PhoE